MAEGSKARVRLTKGDVTSDLEQVRCPACDNGAELPEPRTRRDTFECEHCGAELAAYVEVVE